jgi:hypothetical protein
VETHGLSELLCVTGIRWSSLGLGLGGRQQMWRGSALSKVSLAHSACAYCCRRHTGGGLEYGECIVRHGWR